MLDLWLQLVFMLVLILIAAQLFTNALEFFGHYIGISAGVTGSIFAAIATALPETMVPVLAIVAGTANKTVNQEVGVGAILGAPLMLSTLSTVLMALSVIKMRGVKGRINPEKSGFKRDLNFFLFAFFLAAAAMYVPIQPVIWRAGISVILILVYVLYLFCTFKASKNLVQQGFGVQPDEPLYLTRLGMKANSFSVALQLILALGLLLGGAEGFIHGVEEVSKALGISVLVLSLLIIPIATELPEKVNSIMWVRKGKDTLGFGNISGAMVFQGTLLPALGILLTPWEPTREVETGIYITFLAAMWLRLNITNKGISILALLVNGGFYLLYLGITFL
ncbi:MAG: sodium:calcium antiporter [Pseudomonadota bacterium]